MKKIIFSVLGLALAFSLIVVSCSKNGGYNSMSNNPPAPVASNTVNIVNMSFSPATITVVAGTTITWNNIDNMVHTVTADDNSFNSGDIAVGSKFMKLFSTVGTYAYHCTIHPGMKGTVIVK